jgi:hypothetical protein
MNAADLHAISTEQLARTIFQQIKRRGLVTFSHQDFWQAMVEGPVAKNDENKYLDAWFRLVDRGLIRWREGPSALAHHSLTELGKTSRFDEGVVDDPEPSVNALETAIGQRLDAVIRQYFLEAVAAYRYGRLLSAQFCIGAVAERMVFLVRDWAADKMADGKTLRKRELVGEVITHTAEALVELKKVRKEWTVAIDEFISYSKLGAEVYRRSRNEVGHPAEVRMIDDYDVALLISTMQRRFLPAAYGLLKLSL